MSFSTFYDHTPCHVQHAIVNSFSGPFSSPIPPCSAIVPMHDRRVPKATTARQKHSRLRALEGHSRTCVTFVEVTLDILLGIPMKPNDFGLLYRAQ